MWGDMVDSDCTPMDLLNSGNIFTAITSFCFPRALKLSRVIEGKTVLLALFQIPPSDKHFIAFAVDTEKLGDLFIVAQSFIYVLGTQ